MNFRIVHAIILVFLKVTLKCSWQVHVPNLLPCRGDCLYHIAVNDKLRVSACWDFADSVFACFRCTVCFTGNHCRVIRLFVGCKIGINAECFLVCFVCDCGINSLIEKALPRPPITAPMSGEALFVRAETPTAIFSFNVTISYSIFMTFLSFDGFILSGE